MGGDPVEGQPGWDLAKCVKRTKEKAEHLGRYRSAVRSPGTGGGSPDSVLSLMEEARSPLNGVRSWVRSMADLRTEGRV